MIYVKLNKGQGLGNQLWNIATGFCLAALKGFDFRIINYHLFIGKKIFDFEQYKTDSPKIKNIFYEKLYYDSYFKCQIFDFDENILNVKKNTLIEGNFQSTKYFFGKEMKLKNFLKIKKNLLDKSKVFNNKLIINIRGGEYKRHKSLLLPHSYWDRIYNKFCLTNQMDKICITDDYKYAKRIFPNLEIISDDIESCFAAILGCKSAVVSNSSFSFFPLFLNNNVKDIYAPYQWSRYNNKKDLWISPCNFYPNWHWVDINANIKSRDLCEENLIKTQKYYLDNFQLEFIKIPNENKILDFYKIIKKLIKKLLGLFDWRYE